MSEWREVTSPYGLPVTIQGLTENADGHRVGVEQRDDRELRIVLPDGLRVEIGDRVGYEWLTSRWYEAFSTRLVWSVNGVSRLCIDMGRGVPDEQHIELRREE